jgi:hypothetical protein
MNNSEVLPRSFFCMVVDGRLREISVFEHQAILFPRIMAAIDSELLKRHKLQGVDIKGIRPLTSLSISGPNAKMHDVSFTDAVMIAQSLGIDIDSFEDQNNLFNIPIPGDETLAFQISDFNNNDRQILEDFARILIQAYEVEVGGIVPVKISYKSFGVILVVNHEIYGPCAKHYRPNDEHYDAIISKFSSQQ